MRWHSRSIEMTRSLSSLETGLLVILPALLLAASWFRLLPLDLTESFGFATGAVCVWWVTRENPWNWPMGLLNNIVFAILFWRARLFADMGLQGVYFVLGFYGWWSWLFGGAGRSPLRVGRATTGEWIAVGAVLLLGTAGLCTILVSLQGAAPFWDAATTMLCLCAQFFLTRKRIENWFLWILADVIYVPLYLSRGLALTALLYAGFIVLCVLGLRRWRRSLHDSVR